MKNDAIKDNSFLNSDSLLDKVISKHGLNPLFPKSLTYFKKKLFYLRAGSKELIHFLK